MSTPSISRTITDNLSLKDFLCGGGDIFIRKPDELPPQYWNYSLFIVFVKMSDIFSTMCIFSPYKKLRLTSSQKWWYFIVICLVRGRIRGHQTKSINPLLSSKIVQQMLPYWYWYPVTLPYPKIIHLWWLFLSWLVKHPCIQSLS